jgi:large subunit ribosomal protein L7/L12
LPCFERVFVERVRGQNGIFFSQLKKREQLNAQIQKIRNRESEQQRKEDTRRKILLGALMMELLEKGELDRDKIMAKLDGFLTREIDRKLFDFPVVVEKVEAEEKKEEIQQSKGASKASKSSK